MICVPLLGVRNTCFLAISTPQGEENHFTQMLEERDAEGKLIHNVTDVTLVCEYHAGEKRPMDCLCRISLLPPWKSWKMHLNQQKMV